ncbi:hypothetical protein FHG87_019929 [Trinorchestia longiramus]|nr:hypothetical protein FHG87_019929 [Trinorchestia longiramus]
MERAEHFQDAIGAEAHLILHDDLGLGKLSSRWVPKALRPDQLKFSVSQNDPYRPPEVVEEMQEGDRRVRLEWRAYITV